MTKVHVLVAGGTGLVGKPITKALLAHKDHYIVSVLTREGAADGDKQAALDDFKAHGAKIVTADYSSHDSLVHALKGIDWVVSAVSSTALGDQLPLIAASKDAGVKRFVPSEFGIDTTAVPDDHIVKKALTTKLQVQQAVIDAGLEYTWVITGFFTDSTLTPFFWVDTSAATITIKGDPDAQFTITTLEDVGRLTAQALLEPSSVNSKVALAGQTVTWNHVVEVLEKATGKKFTVTHVSRDDLVAGLATASSPFAWFVDVLALAISDGLAIVKDPHNKPPAYAPTTTVEQYAAHAPWAAHHK